MGPFTPKSMFSLLSYSIEIFNCCTFGIDASPSDNELRVWNWLKSFKMSVLNL